MKCLAFFTEISQFYLVMLNALIKKLIKNFSLAVRLIKSFSLTVRALVCGGVQSEGKFLLLFFLNKYIWRLDCCAKSWEIVSELKFSQIWKDFLPFWVKIVRRHFRSGWLRHILLLETKINWKCHNFWSAHNFGIKPTPKCPKLREILNGGVKN